MENFINVLLVDDHQIVIDGIKSILLNTKYKVVEEALSGEQAWDLISQKADAYEVILTDISMKEMNGLELCQKVKLNFPEIKVMILSMHCSVDYVKEALACEADGYMLKNNGQEEFLFALDSLIENGFFYAEKIIPYIYSKLKHESTHNSPKLTKRELEVLELIIQENTSKEIAEKLFISKQTVDTHRLNIMQKTNSKSIVGLIKYAVKNELTN